MTIKWCIAPEISSVTERKKVKFWKTEKNTWRYPHFIIVYQKSWPHAIPFLRYGVWQMLVFHSGPFFALLPLAAQKIPADIMSLKKKNPADIMSLNKCTKNHIISSTVPEIWHMTDVIVIFSFWALFWPLLLKTEHRRLNNFFILSGKVSR